MRTNIEIDDALMAEAMTLGPFTTKKEVVAAALQLLVQVRKQALVKKLRGKLPWDGSLDTMRRD